MSIDLTAAIEAAAHAHFDDLYNDPYDDSWDEIQELQREEWLYSAKVRIVAAFPLLRDAIAAALEANADELESGYHVASHVDHLRRGAWSVRRLQVAE